MHWLQPFSDIAMFVLSPTRYPQGNSSGMSTPVMHPALITVNSYHRLNDRFYMSQCHIKTSEQRNIGWHIPGL